MLSAYMYYTGIIFRGYTYGTGEAVVKGGRYDELLSHFGSPRPAVGFVVVTNQLMNALERQKIQGPPLRERNLILYTEKNREEAHSLAVIWRKEGRSVELCLSSDGEMREIAERLKGSGEYSKIIQVKEK
jgi:ATP phosphoribosyltransferase regulatory subunit